MKIYYIDDSMFQKTLFSEEIRYRFLHMIDKMDTKLILISCVDDANSYLQEFVSSCKNVPVIVSPALFEIEDIRGNLRTTFLALENYPSMQTFSGSCVEYDTETQLCHRIYLDMFVKHHGKDMSFDILVEELEHIIQDTISEKKKKKIVLH